MTSPRCRVVVTGSDGPDVHAPLLNDLARQSMPASAFEVVVAEDLGAGEGAAVDAAVRSAQAELLVFLDAGMRVGPDFLAAHQAAHAAGTSRVVLGQVRTPASIRAPLHVRHEIALSGRHTGGIAPERQAPSRLAPPCGNFSVRRGDCPLAADRGLVASSLLERVLDDGLAVVPCDGAVAEWDGSGESLARWRRRVRDEGRRAARSAALHPDRAGARAWGRLFQVPALSRSLMLRALASPVAMRRVGSLALSLGRLAAAVRLDRAATSGVALCRDLEWSAGVAEGFGGPAQALAALDAYLERRDDAGLGIRGRFMKLRAAVRADHRALQAADAKYATPTVRHGGGILSTMVTRIGFQMMVAYRVMRLLRGARLGLLARLASRMMRHLYAADIHWDAELEPGVIIVHGTGLVISGAARVGAGSILFQHVTLGINIDPGTRETGAPRLERNVHVGPGAVLLGPIVVGQGTKVMANVVLMRSTPPGSRVETPEPVIRVRDAAGERR